MKIAVLGWGSLIWCPGSLRIASKWFKDGPQLPIEFARVSDDGRLTLVLVNGDSHLQTIYWALSAFSDIDQAHEDLTKRERTNKKQIGVYKKGDTPTDEIKKAIKNWCESKDLDAALWTNLPPRDTKGNENSVITPEEAVEYLKCLHKDEKEKAKRAEEYIRNTPSQIDTSIRQRVRTELRWTDNELSASLFEE